jgi:hypothetical protein
MINTDPFEVNGKFLLPFPDTALRDLARNECAPHEHRKLAVEILHNRKSPYASHADLQEFVSELEAEMDGIVLDHPAPDITPVPAPNPGPLQSSVTTKTLFADGPPKE